jgi:DNA-directed RNA polymerase specialized sigma24 family protein
MGSKVPVSVQHAWLEQLRVRFIDIARVRVAEGAVEDVVQDAIAIIYQKAPGSGVSDWSPPELPWCFQVLRNVVGNHYQRERTRRRGDQPGSALHDGLQEFTAARRNPTPMEALEKRERGRILREAIRELATSDTFCGNHFLEILGDHAPSAADSVADGGAEGSTSRASTKYVRLFRCREKLRKILTRRGYLP